MTACAWVLGEVLKPDPYSRLISWLKIILPLVALAILSTLFLLSRNVDPNQSIPFAEGEVSERIRDQQATNPLYSGTTADGDQISFTARELSFSSTPGNIARNLSARLDFASGSSLTLVADEGIFDLPNDQADISGSILLHSSTGYVIRSEVLNTRLSLIDMHFPDKVDATGPAGDLTAGALHITADENDENTQLLFTNGVKLIYVPKESNE